MLRYAHITGWGMAVPEKVLTNEELAEMVNTNDEWIRARTGIRARHIAGEEESTISMATEAALKALEVANVRPVEVDLIVVATSSPHHLFPATASLVQDNIGAVECGAFDILSACTGFITAMDMASQAVRTGSVDTALVIGTETLSRVIDWTDRTTCILFGDGAGAFVLQGSDEPGGVMSTMLRSDGSGGDLLACQAGGSRQLTSDYMINNDSHFIHMNGREVFRFATRVMARAAEEVIEAADLTVEDIDLIIPHQANKRIIQAAARGLKLPLDRFIINVENYGNTSTASIPIATCEAIEQGRLRPGDKIVFVGFGGGLTWGATTVEWSGPFPSDRKIYQPHYRFYARLRSLYRRLVRRIEGLLFGPRNNNHRK